MHQCPSRDRDGTCIDLNMRLGWKHGLPLPQCDVCHGLGGLTSPEGEAWRESKTAQLVGQFTAPEMVSKLRRDVLVPLTIKHKAIPVSALEGEGEIAWAIGRDVAWGTVKPSWENADAWLTAIKTFGKAALSRGLFDAKAPRSVVNMRHTSCFGVDLVGVRHKPACPWLATSQDGQHHFCSACGCGDRPIAHLDRTTTDGPDSYTKLDYPNLECPRRMAGFTNASG